MNLTDKDLEFLEKTLNGLNNPRPCPCPTCRMKEGDLPPFRLENLEAFNVVINRILNAIYRLPGLRIDTDDILRLVSQIVPLLYIAYAAGVDNARAEKKEVDHDNPD